MIQGEPQHQLFIATNSPVHTRKEYLPCWVKMVATLYTEFGESNSNSGIHFAARLSEGACAQVTDGNEVAVDEGGQQIAEASDLTDLTDLHIRSIISCSPHFQGRFMSR
jgi:hypothetical protein